MNALEHPGKKFRQDVYDEYGARALKTFIIVWALIVIVLALTINDKWVLAGILAWELLP